jgi:hypothetical protein
MTQLTKAGIAMFIQQEGETMKLKFLLCALLVIFAFQAPSHAQATRTWVSGLGDDVNPCSRTAPCKTFAGAISKTVAGGAINCLDSGGFGALTITKAISIVCESLEAGILVAGTNGIVISAGAADVVVLRGLDIEGSGTGLDGVKFTTGAALQIENCVIRGFLGSPGNGILFAPTGMSKLFVSNTIIADNNKGSAAAGILIQPTGSGVARGVVSGVKMRNNGNGLIVDGSTTTGAPVNIVLHSSEVSGNSFNGVAAVSAANKAPVEIVVDRTVVEGNNNGISSTGSGADITLGSSIVTGNNVGLAFTAPAAIRSYQTNELRGNITSNGASSSTIPPE